MSSADDGHSSSKSKLQVSIADRSGRPVRAAGLAQWLVQVAPRRARGSVTVALVSDAYIRELNQRYRGIDRVTDVLSFPGQSPSLGDVVIGTGIARRQARQAGHSLATEYRILALHGLLHLLGYDHERDQGRMARLEHTLRRRGGLERGLIERSIMATGSGAAEIPE